MHDVLIVYESICFKKEDYMIKLYDNGVYLLNGAEIVEDTGNVQVPLSKEEAAKNTMAYGILNAKGSRQGFKH